MVRKSKWDIPSPLKKPVPRLESLGLATSDLRIRARLNTHLQTESSENATEPLTVSTTEFPNESESDSFSKELEAVSTIGTPTSEERFDLEKKRSNSSHSFEPTVPSQGLAKQEDHFPSYIGVPFTSLVNQFETLHVVEKTTSSNEYILEITRKGSYDTTCNSEPFKCTLNAKGTLKQIVLFGGVKKEFSVLENGVFSSTRVNDALADLANVNLVFCVGLGTDSARIVSELPNTPRTVKTFAYPCNHLMATTCEGWFLRRKNSQSQTEAESRDICQECKYVERYLRVCMKRRKASVTSPARRKRAHPSSTCPTKFLSPDSLAKKKKLISYRFHNLKVKAAKIDSKLNDMQMELGVKQHEQMKEVTRTVNEKFSQELDGVLSFVEESANNQETIKETRERLRKAWDMDCDMHLQQEKKEFLHDQSKNSTGCKGNRWSVITYRIALAVACRSKAAYEALLSFKILNLPSWRSIQRKTSKNLDEPGVNHEYIREQKETYDMFAKEQMSLGLPKPVADGVLIFDEVKVAGKVVWNSKNHKLIGLAMPPEEYAYLDDLYREVNEEKEIRKANYMLQFLWRDLSSNYDIIGPYFALPTTADAHVTFGCLFQVLKAFQIHGFNVSAIVCDGASANLSVIKQCVGLDGTFSYKLKNNELEISINVSFPNPFKLERNIHFIICPSHQLKNMVNALFASFADRAKLFENQGIQFGWQQIIDLKARDDNLRDKGVARLVPKLLQAYVERDAWTKLNVKPARILQQNDVLSALYEYANPEPNLKSSNQVEKPKDAKNVLSTYSYLKACQNLFEDGMLSKTQVASLDSPALLNLDQGLQYFTDWLKDIFENDPDFNPSHPRQKKFLSWQTWGLLRIMVFGMKSLAKEFLETYPDGQYYLCPIRINGSAVETLFSQYKHSAGGKISSINFHTLRKHALTKRDIKGHHSGKGYRDVPLYVRDAFKKKFESKKTIEPKKNSITASVSGTSCTKY